MSYKTAHYSSLHNPLCSGAQSAGEAVKIAYRNEDGYASLEGDYIRYCSGTCRVFTNKQFRAFGYFEIDHAHRLRGRWPFL